MKAVLLTGHGGLDNLQFRDDYPIPEVGPGDVLIHVKACGLNNTDINTRTAWYSSDVEQGITREAVTDGYEEASAGDGSWGSSRIVFPIIQGADVCGIVDSVGQDVSPDLVGQRVMVDPWFLDPQYPEDLSRARYYGSEINGGFAEYTLVPAANVHTVNSPLSDTELATFACAYTTAENLIQRTGLAKDETIVISGASGGVGTAAIQLARIRGAQVIALSTPDKSQGLLELGANHVVNRAETNLAEAIRDIAGKAPDVAADVVGGETFTALVDSLRQGGRYSSSGCISGPMVNFDLRKLIYRDLQFTGATVVPKGTFARIVDYIESGLLKPVLSTVFPLEKLTSAQEMFMLKKHIGNIVVTP